MPRPATDKFRPAPVVLQLRYLVTPQAASARDALELVDGCWRPPPTGPADDLDVNEGGPPEHWLAVVREKAPHVLEGRGLGYQLDSGPRAWRAAPRPPEDTRPFRPRPRRHRKVGGPGARPVRPRVLHGGPRAQPARRTREQQSERTRRRHRSRPNAGRSGRASVPEADNTGRASMQETGRLSDPPGTSPFEWTRQAERDVAAQT